MSLNLLGELIVRQAASQDLTSGFHVNYWYNISHLVINTGSIVGSTDDTWVDDGAKLELNETVGGPAFDYELHFKNVPANQVFGIRMNGYYDGNLAHVKKLYEWNFDTVGWDAVTAVADDLPDAVADQDYAWMGGGPDYVSGGEYRLQIVHPAAGNINHDLFIDLLWLDVEFSVDEELLGVLTSRQAGSVDHLGHFIVRQSASQDLKASFDSQGSELLLGKFTSRRTAIWDGDLPAEFIVPNVSIELLAEFISRQASSQDLLGIINIIQFLDLLARFDIQDAGSAELVAGFEIRRSASVELFAEFEVGRSDSVELLSSFLIRVGSDTNRIVIAVDPNSWINFGQGYGTGFLDGPYLGPDRNNRVYGGSSLMFLSEYLKNSFDYIKFGWRKDSEFTSSVWNSDFCVEDVLFVERIVEDWDWDEQTIITNILRDTYTKLEFWYPGGNAGWSHAGNNYGASTALKCSRFFGFPPGTPGELNLDDEETFIKFSLSGLSVASLSRLAWARVELYRYAGGANDINRISARRIAQCWETSASYLSWNPANTIGTCVNVFGPHFAPSNEWDETTLTWFNSGRSALTMGGGQPYMGLPSFTKTAPTVRYGLTADNDEWDMVRITDLLEGWLEGTYGNEGLALLSEQVDGGDSSAELGGGASFYSSRAGSANKPRLRLQYIPAASEDLWSFESPDRWQINLTNPYKGTGALHLIDWSKVSYDESRTNQASVTLTSDYPFPEGAIDTFFRINNATYPRVTYGGVNKWVSHTTPRTNFFNIYIRYQDSDNYYRVQLLPTGSNSTILRRQGGGNTTLQTFDSGIPAGAGWARIRVFWAVDGKGILHICCFRYDSVRGNWRLMGNTEDANNYWSDGGDITFESYDAEIDETRISERIQ